MTKPTLHVTWLRKTHKVHIKYVRPDFYSLERALIVYYCAIPSTLTWCNNNRVLKREQKMYE